MRAMFPATVLLGLLCVTCWSQRSSRIGPDMWSIECKRSRQNCYSEAASICPEGFRVLDGDSSVSGALIIPSGNVAIVAPAYRGEMLIRCETPQPTVAEKPRAPPRKQTDGGSVKITTTEMPRAAPEDGDPYSLEPAAK